jgi:hypothetical protein
MTSQTLIPNIPLRDLTQIAIQNRVKVPKKGVTKSYIIQHMIKYNALDTNDIYNDLMNKWRNIGDISKKSISLRTN